MIFISVDNNKHNIKTNLQNQKSGITELVKTDNHFNNPFSNKLSKNEIYKIKLKGIIYNKNNEPVAIIEVNNKILYKQKNEKVFYWTIKNILKYSIEISDNIKKQKLKMNKEIILKK
jgi:hypothetical protein